MTEPLNPDNYTVIDKGMGLYDVINWQEGWIVFASATVKTRFGLVNYWGENEDHIDPQLHTLNNHSHRLQYIQDIEELLRKKNQPTLEQIESIVLKMDKTTKTIKNDSRQRLLKYLCEYLSIQYPNVVHTYCSVVCNGNSLYDQAKHYPTHLIRILHSIQNDNNAPIYMELPPESSIDV